MEFGTSRRRPHIIAIARGDAMILRREVLTELASLLEDGVNTTRIVTRVDGLEDVPQTLTSMRSSGLHGNAVIRNRAAFLHELCSSPHHPASDGIPHWGND